MRPVSEARSVTEVDEKIGARVRARRIERDMSQEALADLLGITFQQVQKYERGINRVTASRLLDIAIALDMPIASFFEGLGGTRPEKPARALDRLLTTPGAAELLRKFSEIESEKTRRQVIDLVKTMAGTK